MMLRALWPSLWLLTLGACARTSDLPHFDPRGEDPTRLVVDARAAHAHALREEIIEVPFGQRESGTRLVLALMNLARGRGAAWVSDLEFLHVFKYKGELVECSTHLALADQPAAEPEEATPQVPGATAGGDSEMPVYSSSIGAPRPEKLNVRVSEDVVSCSKEGHSYLGVDQKYVNTYDVEVPHLVRRQMPMEQTIKVAWTDHCRMQHVTHDVQRWDFQVKLEWTPPDWSLISQNWSVEPLSDGMPRCYRTTTALIGDPPRHRMRARLYYRGRLLKPGVSPLPPSAGDENVPIRDATGSDKRSKL